MNNNALTSQNDWEKNWKAHKEIRILKQNDAILGKKGAFLKSLRENAGVLSNKKVLELGGASSYYLLSMSMFENMEAVAVDYVETGLIQLEHIFKIHGQKVKTICADIFKYPFEQKNDFVVHWGLLEHFIDPNPVMEVSSKALKSGGKLIFSMPNMRAVGTGLWKKYDIEDYNKHYYHSDESIINSAKLAGLVFEKKFYWGPPLLSNIGYWKTNKLFSEVVKSIVRILALINRVVPFFHKGNSLLSSGRAFVFYKNNQVL